MNIAALIKVVKQASKKGRLYWQVTETGHYVSDSIIALRFDSLPHELKLVLLSVFGEIPPMGTSLSMENKKMQSSTVNFQNIVRPNDASVSSVVSNLYYKDTALSTRIIVSERGDITLVKEEYTEIFSNEPITSTPTSVLFENGICMGIGCKRDVTWKEIISNELKF